MKGFDNLGNTCYFNTAIQCLLQVPILSNYFIVNKNVSDTDFGKEYEEVVKSYWSEKKVFKNLDNLLKLFKEKNKKFDNRDQHDCHEAMLAIIDMLPRECQEIFEGELLQETVYPGGKSQVVEKFSILTMFPDSTGDLLKTFQKFSEWNVLSDYVDENGKKYNCSTTRTMIKKLPCVFVLCFPMYVSKTKITIPDNLLLDGIRYSTFALCTHQGSVHGGHYVAFTKHKEKWYIKNDGLCQEIEHFPTTDFHYIVMFKRIVDETQ